MHGKITIISIYLAGTLDGFKRERCPSGRLSACDNSVMCIIVKKKKYYKDILENIAIYKRSSIAEEVGCTLSSDKNGYSLQRLVYSQGGISCWLLYEEGTMHRLLITMYM